MNDTVVIDGEVNLLSMIDGDLSAAIPADSLEYESGIYKPSGYIITADIEFNRPHSEPPAVVVFCDSTEENRPATASLVWTFIDFAKLSGAPIVASQTSKYYACVNGAYKNTQATVSWVRTNVTSENYTDVTAAGFTASVEPNGATARWQSGVAYKWIAVWR